MTPTPTPEEIAGAREFRPTYPRCGHCGMDPLEIFGSTVKIGGHIAVIFACVRCRAAYSVTPIQTAQPETSPIYVPNGRM